MKYIAMILCVSSSLRLKVHITVFSSQISLAIPWSKVWSCPHNMNWLNGKFQKHSWFELVEWKQFLQVKFHVIDMSSYGSDFNDQILLLFTFSAVSFEWTGQDHHSCYLTYSSCPVLCCGLLSHFKISYDLASTLVSKWLWISADLMPQIEGLRTTDVDIQSHICKTKTCCKLSQLSENKIYCHDIVCIQLPQTKGAHDCLFKPNFLSNSLKQSVVMSTQYELIQWQISKA